MICSEQIEFFIYLLHLQIFSYYDNFTTNYFKTYLLYLLQIYHEDEFECSDVCECEIGEKLTCKTICIDRMPCKTEFAYYNHAAPAYQAYRGRCLCYSGHFICIKPSPSDIRLPQGIYLFLGYSEVDERELNKNQTRFIIQDVVRALQEFILQEAVNGVSYKSFLRAYMALNMLVIVDTLFVRTF